MKANDKRLYIGKRGSLRMGKGATPQPFLCRQCGCEAVGRRGDDNKFCTTGCANTASLGRCKAGLNATVAPTRTDIVWAAGIYEGEGHCAPRGTVTVAQKERWILDKLQAVFGGSVNVVRSGRIHHWILSGSRARGFLMTIYQFLSPHRKAQVRKGIVI